MVECAIAFSGLSQVRAMLASMMAAPSLRKAEAMATFTLGVGTCIVVPSIWARRHEALAWLQGFCARSAARDTMPSASFRRARLRVPAPGGMSSLELIAAAHMALCSQGTRVDALSKGPFWRLHCPAHCGTRAGLTEQMTSFLKQVLRSRSHLSSNGSGCSGPTLRRRLACSMGATSTT